MSKKSQYALVHIIGGLQGGGRERRMLELVKTVDKHKEKYVQYIILLNKRIDYPDVYATSAKIITVDYPSKWKTITEIFKLLYSIKPDILHVWTEIHYILFEVCLLKLLLQYKLVVGFLADGNPIKSFLCRVSYKLSYILADKIISNSKAGLIAKEAPLEKSEVIYNGFSFSRFEKFKEYNKDSIKLELGVDSNFIVSMIARFNVAKDWDTFLRIAQFVNEKRKDIKFLAVGQGELLDRYKKMAVSENIDNVVFTGFRKDIDRILFCSDICLLCTNENIHAEGVSNSIMEAMAAAKPVIATMGGGTPEIINDGIDGFIIPPKDYVQCSDIILNLVQDSSKMIEIGDAAKNRISKHFSLDYMGSKYLELYNTLIN